MGKEAAILGMTLFAVSPADLRSIHAALGAALANGSLSPVVGREFPLGDAAKARERLGWEPRVRFDELVRLLVDAAVARLTG